MGGTSSPVSVAQELGLGLTSTISMNQSNVRTLAGVGGSGTAWSMSSLYGKANAFNGTISSNQTNLNLRTWALANGWNGSTAATITVAGGVYIYSTVQSTPGLTINGSWPGGITLINNGFIMGKGGYAQALSAGNQAGGVAISLGVSCSIVNNSYIGGGGGGGGNNRYNVAGGGGAGGGDVYFSGGITSAGGGPGSTGANGVNTPGLGGTNGGAGGRIFPGTGGSGGRTDGVDANAITAAGAGGGGGAVYASKATVTSGAGGAGGAAGGNYTVFGSLGGGGGGGWGASGGAGDPFGGGIAAGAGGRAIQLNGYTATRTGGGTTYGAVS
jgi:hypothetical protein